MVPRNSAYRHYIGTATVRQKLYSYQVYTTRTQNIRTVETEHVYVQLFLYFGSERLLNYILEECKCTAASMGSLASISRVFQNRHHFRLTQQFLEIQGTKKAGGLGSFLVLFTMGLRDEHVWS